MQAPRSGVQKFGEVNDEMQQPTIPSPSDLFSSLAHDDQDATAPKVVSPEERIFDSRCFSSEDVADIAASDFLLCNNELNSQGVSASISEAIAVQCTVRLIV